MKNISDHQKVVITTMLGTSVMLAIMIFYFQASLLSSLLVSLNVAAINYAVGIALIVFVKRMANRRFKA